MVFKSNFKIFKTGPTVCSKEYETVCDTKLHENVVTDEIANCRVEMVEKCPESGGSGGPNTRAIAGCVQVPQQVCDIDQVENNKVSNLLTVTGQPQHC